MDKPKVLMTNGSLMKVKSRMLPWICNAFDLYKAIFDLEKQVLVFFLEWPLKTALLYLWILERVNLTKPLN